MGYDDLNTGCAAAMCYLSSGKKLEGYSIFKECLERMKELPEPQNPHESEIYIVIAWRYCDVVAEYYELFCSIISELENTVITMNQVLDYLVHTEQNGFSDLSGWKPQMVMTAAKIQGKLAEIKSKSIGITGEVKDHLFKAVEIVEKVPEIYDEWDKIGFEYDRLAAMRNFINVAAIYAEAFQIDKGIEILKDTLERFKPENEIEEKERELIRQKIVEFKGYAAKHRESF